MTDKLTYWEYFVTDDYRRRYVSKTFVTNEECWTDVKSKLDDATGSNTFKIVVKMHLTDGEKLLSLTDVKVH